MKKYISHLFSVFLGLVCGLVLAPGVEYSQPFVTYVPGETIRDTIYMGSDTVRLVEYVPTPGETKIITVYDPSGSIDSTASLRATAEDWNVKRDYSGNAFRNDTIGVFDYTATVQYNRLHSLSYEFTPITKNSVVEVKQKNVIKPFIFGGYNTNNNATFGAGLKFKDVGYSLKYDRNFKTGSDAVGINMFIFF